LEVRIRGNDVMRPRIAGREEAGSPDARHKPFSSTHENIVDVDGQRTMTASSETTSDLKYVATLLVFIVLTDVAER
jgi:hypothetical protein